MKTTADVEFLKLSDAPKEGGFVDFGGERYPIKKVGQDYMAIDQSKVLLHFLLLLHELLARKVISPEIRFTESYLRGIDRFHFVH